MRDTALAAKDSQLAGAEKQLLECTRDSRQRQTARTSEQNTAEAGAAERSEEEGNDTEEQTCRQQPKVPAEVRQWRHIPRQYYRKRSYTSLGSSSPQGYGDLYQETYWEDDYA